MTIRAVGLESLPTIAAMNRTIFDEERIINRLDRPDLVILVAYVEGEPAGFKIGYGLDRKVYYSAKGGTFERFRRRGIANNLLTKLMEEAVSRGYTSFCFDTFPNQHIGMALLALRRGFVVSEARFSDIYDDLRVRFTSTLDVDR